MHRLSLLACLQGYRINAFEWINAFYEAIATATVIYGTQ
jgi:hypothetical protein